MHKLDNSGLASLRTSLASGDDRERGDTRKYYFEDINVGNIEYISLFLDKTLEVKDYWYIEYVNVRRFGKDGKDGKSLAMFPMHSWITEHRHHEKVILISSNKTTIPQRETHIRQMARSQETKKDSLDWQHSLKGFFGFTATKPEFNYESLDWNLKYHDSQDRNFYRRFDASIMNGKLQHFMSVFKSFKKLEDFTIAPGTLSSVCYKWMKNDLWKTDVEFGRQILNGANPFSIRKCKQLPSNFPLKEAMVRNILNRGMTLEQEIEAGNIFIIDYQILENISTGKYRDETISLASPICLFYVKNNKSKSDEFAELTELFQVKKNNQSDELIPLAIQLGQTPGEKCPIWTPNDAPLDWLLAKMWFKNADMQIQRLENSTARVHLFLEPIAIAMYRCLPPVHPVYKILREHLQFAIATNTIARETLICKVNTSNYYACLN